MAKAKLTPMDASGQNPVTSQAVEADFNPQSLSVSLQTLGAGGAQPGAEPRTGQGTTGQPTGYNTTLTVELLFDTTRDGSNVQDKTDKITAVVQALDANRPSSGQNRPPRVQFLWGSFVFYGVIQSIGQNLDYFSEEGVPLRATIHLSLTEYDVIHVSLDPEVDWVAAWVVE